MQSPFDLDLPDPTVTRCECCQGTTVRLTRFVYRLGDAYAVYYATYTNEHAEGALELLVSLGPWNDESHPSQRVAFYGRVRAHADTNEVVLGDASTSLWRDVEIVGKKLTRDEAVGHPWKAQAFEVMDEAFAQDPTVRGYLQRMQSARGGIPLERNFGMPDDVFALGERRDARAQVGRNFVTLDGTRFFVRCILPITVEHYGRWHVGTWVETTKTDFDRAQNVWQDKVLYPTLRFSGVLANDVEKDLELPLTRGTQVQVRVPEDDHLPEVDPGIANAVGTFLRTPWSRQKFEEYAVARGFL